DHRERAERLAERPATPAPSLRTGGRRRWRLLRGHVVGRRGHPGVLLRRHAPCLLAARQRHHLCLLVLPRAAQPPRVTGPAGPSRAPRSGGTARRSLPPVRRPAFRPSPAVLPALRHGRLPVRVSSSYSSVSPAAPGMPG